MQIVKIFAASQNNQVWTILETIFYKNISEKNSIQFGGF